MVDCEAASLYRILENQGHLMVDAGARQKLHSFAIDFAFQGFQGIEFSFMDAARNRPHRFRAHWKRRHSVRMARQYHTHLEYQNRSHTR
jgi:hypothetical protein